MHMAASMTSQFLRSVYAALYVFLIQGANVHPEYCLYCTFGSQNQMPRTTNLLDIFLHKANEAL